MNGPKHPAEPADRFLACQEAMEDHFLEIMDAATAAGWTPAEAAAAITDLADNYVLKLFAIEETERQIVAAVQAAKRR